MWTSFCFISWKIHIKLRLPAMLDDLERDYASNISTSMLWTVNRWITLTPTRRQNERERERHEKKWIVTIFPPTLNIYNVRTLSHFCTTYIELHATTTTTMTMTKKTNKRNNTKYAKKNKKKLQQKNFYRYLHDCFPWEKKHILAHSGGKQPEREGM